MTTYAELRLRIDRGATAGSYRIQATGPAGEALGTFESPFSDVELENFILKVGTNRRGRRRVESPEMELAKNFGTRLFDALFKGDVGELYRSSSTETRGAGEGLRLTLSLTGAPELLNVPWEYLYDHPSFLSISTWTPIVRYLDLAKPRRPLEIDLPLRILALVSAPSDAEPIDVKGERTKLESALGPLIATGAVAIDWLEDASLRALQRQLRKADYHVFHYIGHGGYDQFADDGVLLFEDENGLGQRVSGVQLGTILADEVTLRLAVLNSCEGARTSLQDPFSGVASSLIQREIPAVIGMQFEITDRAAIVFAGEFYSALADGLPVDSSVAEARKAIYADQNDIEWGTPVLFMRVADGQLFDVAEHTPIRSPDAGPPPASSVTEGAPVPPPVPAEAEVSNAVTGTPALGAQRDPSAPVVESEAVVPAQPAAVSPELLRVAGRAAFGGAFVVAIQKVGELIVSPPESFDVGDLVNTMAWMAIVMAAVVTVVEALVPLTRVPDGRLYNAVGGNRWVAAAIEGACVGATVGLALTVLPDNLWLLSFSEILLLAFLAAVGFVIAEIPLGLAWPRARGRDGRH